MYVYNDNLGTWNSSNDILKLGFFDPWVILTSKQCILFYSPVPTWTLNLSPCLSTRIERHSRPASDI